MEQKCFSELYDQIQVDSSILLLGQNYFSISGQTDPIWGRLIRDFFPGLGLSVKKPDYPQLWAEKVMTEEDAENIMAKIAEAKCGEERDPAIDKIMSLRWSLIYTSAFDDSVAMESLRGYTPVPPTERNAKHQYLTKGSRYRVNLCGDAKNPPPPLTEMIHKKQFDSRIAQKVRWISETYLEFHGVLVIDGFDPEHDWLTDQILFEPFINHEGSAHIYWFSAPSELGEYARMLEDRGVLTTEKTSFYEQLFYHMPELVDADTSDSADEEDDDVLFMALTLNLPHRNSYTIHIKRSQAADITGSNLCVIDDNILSGGAAIERDRTAEFAAFLMQDGIPIWRFFMKGRGTAPAYYIPRDKDDELAAAVRDALGNTGTDRSPVILCGPSNSGKSMMLAKLAVDIASRRKYPVIFIRGEIEHGAEGRLKEFINNWFCSTERFGGRRPDKTVVIWDGSGQKRTERDYINLQSILFSCNAQVIGSSYTSKRADAIRLTQNLSQKEKKSMDTLLASLGGGLEARFNEIQRHQSKAATLKNSTLLYLLQALFRYEFDDEYKDLSLILSKQFKGEKTYAEQSTSKELETYVESFYRAQEERARLGIASSFRAQLQLILDQISVEKRAEAAADTSGEEEKIKGYKHLEECILNIDKILAVATEFGVQIPLHLILKFLRDKDGGTFVYNEETAKIIEILRSDTLLNFTLKNHPTLGEEYYVSFRNSIEAENYICILCDVPLEDHQEARKRKEVEILQQIINSAESDVDIWSTLELTRQFGPNGHGMLSELEKTSRDTDYIEYKDYWLEIADCLIKRFPNNPEAVRLYAHFTREYIARDDPDHYSYYEELLEAARTRLIDALEELNNNSAQYSRLSIELGANYQQGLRYKYLEANHKEIKRRVFAAFVASRSGRADEIRREFSSNAMLDILLNAYNTFQAAVDDPKRKEEELATTLGFIEDMLNLDDLLYDHRYEIISKVMAVFEELGPNSPQMERLEKSLLDANSDMFIYLKALRLWQERQQEQPVRHGGTRDDRTLELIVRNRYFYLCNDIPYSCVRLTDQLKAQMRADAERAIAFLTENDEMIKKTQSERCIAMLMRAKWFIKTGNPILSEGQRVALSRNDWLDINRLCDRYHSYCPGGDFIPAYFLKGVYEWIYGEGKKAKEYFRYAKELVGRGDAKSRVIDRLVLCKENTTIPRTFIVDVEQEEYRRATARINKETTPMADSADDNVSKRYGIGIPDKALELLFNGVRPREQHILAEKEAEIRFNLIGAQVGMASGGGTANEQ